MYYVGIVGALSSLGKGVIAKLEAEPSEFKVVFKVDDRYPQMNLVKGEFQHLEQILSCGINPTLVLDFGVPEKVFERAKFYRSCGIPAIMQTVFGEEKCQILGNVRGLTESDYPPLVLVPDFSVIKVLMVNNLKSLVQCLSCDVSRIHIDVLYNTERYNNQNQWLYWAYVINEKLGEHTTLFRQDGCTLTCGFVQYGFMRIRPMDKNEESINVQIFSAERETPFRSELRYNLLSSRITGVMKVLDWYRHRDEKSSLQNINNVFVDTLALLI